MAQKLESSQDLDLVREWFENKPNVTQMIHWFNGEPKKWEEHVAEKFLPKAKILDVGCGLGREAYALFGMGFTIVGVDTSLEVIHQVTGMVSNSGYPIRFIWYDGQTLPFEDGEFDAVIIWGQTFGLMYGDAYKNVFIKECGRVLKSGGLLSFTAYDYKNADKLQHTDGRKYYLYPDAKVYWEMFLSTELRAFAEKAGFTVTECTHAETNPSEKDTVLQCLCRKP